MVCDHVIADAEDLPVNSTGFRKLSL